jgi:hypothetical protein
MELLTHCDQEWWNRTEQVMVAPSAVRGAGATASPPVLKTRTVLRCAVCGITAQAALAEHDEGGAG